MTTTDEAKDGKAPSLKLPMAAMARVLERMAEVETDPALKREGMKRAAKAQEIAGREP